MVKRYRCIFVYQQQQVPFFVWANMSDAEPPSTMVLLGTGQTGRLPYWVARATQPGTVVVPGAPHWLAHPSAEDLYDFMEAYTLAAVQSVRQLFGAQRVHMVAESQAAPAAIVAARKLPDVVHNVVLIAPLGFLAEAWGGTQEARLRTLHRRALKSMLQLPQSPLHDPRNLYAGLMILRAMLSESERGASWRKYAKGLAYDVRQDCQKLLAAQQQTGARCMVVAGDRDCLFPATEIMQVIAKAGLDGVAVHVLPAMTHSSLATRGGRQALRTAVELAKS